MESYQILIHRRSLMMTWWSSIVKESRGPGNNNNNNKIGRLDGDILPFFATFCDISLFSGCGVHWWSRGPDYNRPNLHYASPSHFIHSPFLFHHHLVSHSPSETKEPITVQELDHISVLEKVFRAWLVRMETFAISANHAFRSTDSLARFPSLTLNHSDSWFISHHATFRL